MKPEIEARLVEWVREIEERINQDRAKHVFAAKLTILKGSKNVKIRIQDIDRSTEQPPSEFSGSVYCFIRAEDGAILKAASWKAPAKGVRGSIFDANYSWGKGVGPYGASYLR